jgi:transposase
MTDLADLEVRSYVPEPDRGRRDWEGKEAEREAVYGNRRRVRGRRGKRLLRRRGEYIERSFAHAYETGGLRRVHLRGRANILKRLLVHVGGFNLGLVMRGLVGKGTPRGFQGLSSGLLWLSWGLLWVVRAPRGLWPGWEARRGVRNRPASAA